MRFNLTAAIGAGTLFACALLSCSRISTVSECVYIPGDAPVEEKLAIAQSIGQEVWEAGLSQQVHEKFPELSPEDLAGVFLRWEAISIMPVTGTGAAGTGVRIRTGIEHRGGVHSAQAIAKLCADSVEAAVRRRTGAPDVHRIDLSEQTLGF